MMMDAWEFLKANGFWVTLVLGVVGLVGLWRPKWLFRNRDTASHTAEVTAPPGGWRARAIVGWLNPEAHPVIVSVVWAAVLQLAFSLWGGWGVDGGWEDVRGEDIGSVTLPGWSVLPVRSLVCGFWCVLAGFLVRGLVRFIVRVLSRLRGRPLFPSLLAPEGGPQRAGRLLNVVVTVAVVGVSLGWARFEGRGVWCSSLITRGNAWCEEKEYDKAIEDFTEAIRLRPRFALAYFNRGKCWYAKQEYNPAIADFTEAIRLRPTYGSYTMRGHCRYDKQEFDRAIEDYTEAIRLEDKHAKRFINRGLAWSHMNEPDKAIADFTEAIRLDPADALAFQNRGLEWREKQEYGRAIADFTEAIRLKPTFADAFSERGRCWYIQQEPDQAIADYTEAIRLLPTFAYAFTGRGNAWGDKNEYDEAIKDYTEAIRLDPTDPVVFHNRGDAWSRKNEYDKAIADFTRAIQLRTTDVGRVGRDKRAHDKSTAGTFFGRGCAWYHKRKYDQAIADFTEAIRLDPTNALAFNNRGAAYSVSGDTKRAAQDYAAAEKLQAKGNGVRNDP